VNGAADDHSDPTPCRDGQGHRNDCLTPQALGRVATDRTNASGGAGNSFGHLCCGAIKPTTVEPGLHRHGAFHDDRPSASLPLDYTFTAQDAASIASSHAVTMDSQGLQVLTVTDHRVGDHEGRPANNHRRPRHPDTVHRFPLPASRPSARRSNITVTAVNGGNRDFNTRQRAFHQQCVGGVVPADYPFTQLARGQKNNRLRQRRLFNARATQSGEATDTVASHITAPASSQMIPAAASHFSIAARPAPVPRSVHDHGKGARPVKQVGNNFSDKVAVHSNDPGGYVPVIRLHVRGRRSTSSPEACRGHVGPQSITGHRHDVNSQLQGNGPRSNVNQGTRRHGQARHGQHAPPAARHGTVHRDRRQRHVDTTTRDGLHVTSSDANAIDGRTMPSRGRLGRHTFNQCVLSGASDGSQNHHGHRTINGPSKGQCRSP